MAKKIASKKSDAAKPVVKAMSSTPVRQSPIPKSAKSTAAPTAAPSFDQIARRAYELYASGAAGSEADHWFQAERELRAGA